MLTWQQAGVWRTSESLWTNVVSVSPLKPAPHLALGLEYQAQHRYKEAKEQYAKAFSMSDGWKDAKGLKYAVGLNLAYIIADEGRTQDAFKLLKSLEEPFPQSLQFTKIAEMNVLKKAGMPCERIGAFLGPTVDLKCG